MCRIGKAISARQDPIIKHTPGFVAAYIPAIKEEGDCASMVG